VAERAVVTALGGGCQTPIGALATPTDPAGPDDLELLAVVVAPDGSRAVRAEGRARRADAAALGARVARQLLDAGAGDILAEANDRQSQHVDR